MTFDKALMKNEDVNSLPQRDVHRLRVHCKEPSDTTSEPRARKPDPVSDVSTADSSIDNGH